MKTRILILSILGFLLAGATPKAKSQGTNGNFFSSVTGYFTSFNTNLDSTFSASRGSLWTSVASLQGAVVPLEDRLGLDYNLWKGITVESITGNSGVAGTLTRQQIGFGLNFVVHDIKITAYADPGWDFSLQDGVNAKGKTIRAKRLYGEFGLRVKKALTPHTFGYTAIAAQVPKNVQVFEAGAGFTF